MALPKICKRHKPWGNEQHEENLVKDLYNKSLRFDELGRQPEVQEEHGCTPRFLWSTFRVEIPVVKLFEADRAFVKEPNGWSLVSGNWFNLSTSDIAIEFADFQISPQIKFESVTFDLPLKDAVMKKDLLQTNATDFNWTTTTNDCDDHACIFPTDGTYHDQIRMLPLCMAGAGSTVEGLYLFVHDRDGDPNANCQFIVLCHRRAAFVGNNRSGWAIRGRVRFWQLLQRTLFSAKLWKAASRAGRVPGAESEPAVVYGPDEYVEFPGCTDPDHIRQAGNLLPAQLQLYRG